MAAFTRDVMPASPGHRLPNLQTALYPRGPSRVLLYPLRALVRRD